MDLGLPAPHAIAKQLINHGRGSVPELLPEDEEIVLCWHNENLTSGHAGFGEVALMLGVNPEAVHLDKLGIESGIPTGRANHLRNAGIKIADYGWDINVPNSYQGVDPIDCNERIGRASVRMETEKLVRAVKVFKEDTLLLSELEKAQKNW